MTIQQKTKKVLFYAGGSYGFRSLAIWHFFEVCQKYQTVLLSEKLDPEIEDAINNKDFFPKLEEISYLPKHSLDSYKAIIKKNKILYEEAKRQLIFISRISFLFPVRTFILFLYILEESPEGRGR